MEIAHASLIEPPQRPVRFGIGRRSLRSRTAHVVRIRCDSSERDASIPRFRERDAADRDRSGMFVQNA
jgi:hypothetical protein